MVINGNIKKIMNQITKKTTVREILQQVGTEFGRNLSPNIWVNGLFSNYKSPCHNAETKEPCSCMGVMCMKPVNWIITDMRFPNELEAVKKRKGITIRVNRWVKNELTEEEAADLYVTGDTQVFGVDDNGVESRIRIAEDFNNFSRFVTELPESNHESETALDNFKLDYTLDNNGTLEELIEKIRQILIKEQIL